MSAHSLWSSARRARFGMIAAAMVAGACSLVAAPHHAHAQDKAMAEALFETGRQLMTDGKYAEACPKLEQSQKIEPKLGTLLNLALCHEGLGRTATAWAEFTEAASQAERRNEAGRADFAKEHANAMKAILSKIVFEKSPDAPTNVTIDIDGKILDSATMTGVPLPFDPGEHTIKFSAPGFYTKIQTVTLGKGPIEEKVMIPALEKKPDPVIVPEDSNNKVKPDPDPPEQPPKKEEPSSPAIPIAITGFTVGGVSLIVGIITGSVTLAMGSELDAACKNDICSGEDANKLDTANALANTANVTLALAGVGAVVGLIGVLIAPPAPSGKQASARFISVGDAGGGIAIDWQ